MKYTIAFVGLFYFGCFVACNSPNQPEGQQVDPPPPTIAAPAAPLTFTVNINNLRLRDVPGTEGKELAKLISGTELTDLGKVSDFTTKIKFRGVPYDEPWIKVKTTEGLSGWVYAGGLSFDLNNTERLPKMLQQNRLHSLFGQQMTKEIMDYRAAYGGAKTSEAMAGVYTQGRVLRDSMTRLLADKILIDDPSQLPDLFWLEDAMPGFETALVAEGTAYYLFMNYHQMERKAAQTTGKADDEFTQLCYQVFKMDSIEYFYPAWFMQTWDYGGHSLLGEGIHHSLLEKMNALVAAETPFEREIQLLKDRLVNDIVWGENSYWQPKDKILKELETIRAANFRILTKADRVAIATRRNMFKSPKANKIEVNLRAGSL